LGAIRPRRPRYQSARPQALDPRYDESVPLFRAAGLALLACVCLRAQSATVLVLRFNNSSQFSELNWVGESIAETLRAEFGRANQIVIDRSAGLDGMKRLGLRPEADFTKASIIRLSRTLQADLVVYGDYQVTLPPGVSHLKDANISINAHSIDLRKLQNAPDISEAGKVSELSKYKEHLAWEALGYLNPAHETFEQFMRERELTPLDAEESYIHGLLSADKEHRQKWFLQAANLAPQFVSPAYELGKLYLEREEPRQALKWLERVPAGDPRYLEARFRMGVAAYQAGDFSAAVGYFKGVANVMPLNEVYNNLAAAEDQLNLPPAIDDFRRAVDGDPADASYLFNLGAALLRRNLFEEAKQKLQAVIDRSPDDAEADELLAQAVAHQVSSPAAKPLAPARLKTSMDSTAFRQLKAMLQPKAK
jgi:tetratricopeptide (TPR) repeat protein